MVDPAPHSLPRILLVEDDDGIARPLKGALEGTGYHVTRAANGADALAAAAAADLVILDLGLPDMDGLDVCRAIRQRVAPTVPILILTARTTEMDLVVGLDAGADDYVGKPFRLAELQARVRALLRRGSTATGADHDVVAALDVRVDVDARRAWRADTELDLTPKEFDLLTLLVTNAGSVVTREDAIHGVWDERWYGSTKTLDVHVSSLRRKLGDDPAEPRYIATVRGVGLRFEEGAP